MKTAPQIAATRIKQISPLRPKLAIVLGSGKTNQIVRHE
jgi:hypothetical protein